VDARSEYSFALTPTNTFAIVSNAAFSLKSLRVAAKGSAENLLELEDLSVSAVSADAAARTADVGSVFVNGGRVAAQRDSAGTFNFIELSRPATDATNVPAGIQFTLQAATNAFAALIGTTNLWSASLRQLNVTNFVVRWQDDACSRPVNVTVDDIAVSGRHLSNLPGSNQTVDVSCRWETNGVVRLEVAAQILPPSADVKLALKDLDLRPVDPYLEPFVNVFVIHSKVNLDGLAQLRMGSNSLPEVTFRGDAALNDFATADGVFRGDLVKWKSVQISGVDASLSPPVVAVKQVSVTEPHARITIETNRMVNVFVALRIGDTNAVGGESNEVAVARPTEPKPETSKAGMGRRLGSLLRKTLAANTNASGSALLPAIAVDSVVLSNASIQFNDRSLQPPVSASILDINGSVGSLSSAELNRADLHLTAKVDGTGPIEISGKINPLNESAPTELEVTFQNVDLSPASPYAARFLGYRLNRGKLNLNVNCGITDQKLKATNLIALDQLKLGQRVNSPDATQLPVKLAVIILTDSEGKIKLDVPIEGDLDDPQFRFGKAVAAVIGNIITKLVTSPFSTLGGLFGGKGEEIAYQDFIPGSAELLPASVEKLDAVLNGLAKQPDLELGVEGSYDPVKDRDALRRQKLDRQFRQEKWSAMRSGAQARVNPDAVTISPDERQEYLAKAYETLLEAQQAAEGGASDSQSVRKQPAPEKAAEAMVRAFRPTPPPAAINDMERTVLDSIAVNDGELQELAVRRAQQVRDRILESGRLSPERVYMVDVQVPPGNNAASRVYLHLQ
jgi:hypothetical protein